MIVRNRFGLADGATSPAPAAPATTAAAAASPAAAAPDSTAAATATAPPSDLLANLMLRTLLVEDVEGRQADVGNLFLAENDFVVRRGLLRGQASPRRSARRGQGATR